MGTVWRAHNELLDAPLALKLIRHDARWSGSSERLLNEAKAAACLRHPSIVRVFDFGMTEHDDPFIAMELLQGETLRELLDREGSLAAAQAIRCLLPILRGLHCAHARGIIHRDLKPDNIFLAHDDGGGLQPKVVDFGIAKVEGAVTPLTTRGVLLGSPSYMSPEQALGEAELDARADVWAIAVVLYESIAGHPPWEAPSCPALLRAIIDDRPPRIVGMGGVDAQLWSILQRGLAKKREDRWPSSEAFGTALAGWLCEHRIADDVTGASLRTAWLSAALSSNANRPRRRVRRWTMGVGGSVAACLAIAAVALRSGSSESASLTEDRTVTTGPIEIRALPTPAAADPVAKQEAPRPATIMASTPVVQASALPLQPTRASRPDAAGKPRARSTSTPAATVNEGKASAAPIRKGSARAMDFGF